MSRPLLSARDLTYAYRLDEPVLDGVDLDVAPGEMVALVGSSGSGKSTLLKLLGALLRPDTGSLSYDGERFDRSTDRSRARLRLERFGFVFQDGDLLPELDVVQNVALPLRLLGRSRRDAEAQARQDLARLHIGDLERRRLNQVSGGQLQRIALARALAHRPPIVFADEPTGSLDSDSALIVLGLLHDLARHDQTAVVLATHDRVIAAACDRVLALEAGRLMVKLPAGDAF